MKDLTNKSVFDLANRMNEINKEINQLEMEYNRIIDELHTRLPHLKEDENLQHKVLRKKICTKSHIER